MKLISTSPDVSQLEIPMDQWTEPFWQAGSEGRLAFPRCGECGHFRWPSGPFCPSCQSQAVDWVDPGPGRIFSFTVMREPAADDEAATLQIPLLVEFPEANGIRLLAALVDAAADEVVIGAAVTPAWLAAANAAVPVFTLKD
ncbi:MAG: zinc ribbon domain-containing protein [Novosphingobium sp.]